MMLSRVVLPPQGPVSATLESLVNWGETRGLKGVQLQAPSGNAGVVNYGGHDDQPIELAAGLLTDVLPVTHLNDLKVRSTNGTDTIRVLIFI